MTCGKHFVLGCVLGGIVAIAPDIVLATFGWRRDWLPETHLLVRIHRYLHSPGGLVPVVVALAWTSHIVADWFSTHRTGP